MMSERVVVPAARAGVVERREVAPVVGARPAQVPDEVDDGTDVSHDVIPSLDVVRCNYHITLM